MKKILVLGGTMFIGRAFVERLRLLSGYEITLFNRGKSNAGLFTGLKQIHGDRETGIQNLAGQSWDCVVDFSGYYPESFQKLLNVLNGNVGRYIFISTISVFDIGKYAGRAIVEEDETVACSVVQKISRLPDAYGEKKAEMERMLLAQEGMDKIIFRPSFIYGKYDWTERFYYWLYRARFADKILVPGPETFNVSFTNSDDLTEALIQSLNIKKHHTIYHSISQESNSIREMIEVCARALGKQPEIISIDKEQLEKLELSQQSFPLYVPLDFIVARGKWLMDFPFKRADMAQTFLEMLELKSAEGFPKPKAGLSFDKEQAILASLK